MENEELIQIPYIVHETAVTRLYKIIKGLVITIIVLCVLFVGYICVDRYLDTETELTASISQDSSDEASNYYNNGGDFINGKTDS